VTLQAGAAIPGILIIHARRLLDVGVRADCSESRRGAPAVTLWGEVTAGLNFTVAPGSTSVLKVARTAGPIQRSVQ
jgi:hypothetical protein